VTKAIKDGARKAREGEPVLAWAMKGPDGQLRLVNIHRSRAAVETWAECTGRDKDHTIVQVEIREVH